MGFDVYHKVGEVINGRLSPKDDFQGVFLGAGFAHYEKDMKSPESEVSSIADASIGLSDLLNSPILQSPGYKISNPKALERSWMNDPNSFIGIMNKAAMGAALAPAAIMALPSIYQYGAGALKYGYEGMKLYHNSIGVNGGYANAGLNWINQSYVQGGNPSDYLSLEGKSLTGLILAGSMGNLSIIFKQAAVGAADPWLSVNYSNNSLVLNGVHNQGIHKTSLLSILGVFGPLYKQVPLFNSSGLNFLIEQGLIAPLQKTVTYVQD